MVVTLTLLRHILRYDITVHRIRAIGSIKTDYLKNGIENTIEEKKTQKTRRKTKMHCSPSSESRI
jgi:hypothetical protein